MVVENIKLGIQSKKNTWRKFKHLTQEKYGIQKMEKKTAKRFITEALRQLWEEFGQKLKIKSNKNLEQFYKS